MKLKALFDGKNKPVFLWTLLSVTVFVSFLGLLLPPVFEHLCFVTRPDHIWQVFTGIFVHIINPVGIFFVHLGMNLIGLIPFGILLEKRIGTKTLALFTLGVWLLTSLLFQLITWNNPSSAAGISAIGYAYAGAGFPYAFSLLKGHWKEAAKQPLFWYFAFEAVGLLSQLNPLLGTTSLLLHTAGLLSGILFSLLYRRKHP